MCVCESTDYIESAGRHRVHLSPCLGRHTCGSIQATPHRTNSLEDSTLTYTSSSLEEADRVDGAAGATPREVGQLTLIVEAGLVSPRARAEGQLACGKQKACTSVYVKRLCMCIKRAAIIDPRCDARSGSCFTTRFLRAGDCVAAGELRFFLGCTTAALGAAAPAAAGASTGGAAISAAGGTFGTIKSAVLSAIVSISRHGDAMISDKRRAAII